MRFADFGSPKGHGEEHGGSQVFCFSPCVPLSSPQTLLCRGNFSQLTTHILQLSQTYIFDETFVIYSGPQISPNMMTKALALLGMSMMLLTANHPPEDILTDSALLRTVENNTFQRGEWLKFRVHYGFVTAGYLEMEVKGHRPMRQGRPCYHIVGRGYSHPAFEWFYTVDDKYESFCDEQAMVSWEFRRQIREGEFSAYTETHFDQHEQKARYIDNKKRERMYDVPVNVQDVISSFYYARARYDHNQFQPGDRIELHNFIDRKPYRLEAKFLKREIIEMEDVEYRALKFDLLIEEVGMITDGSTIRFWISDDENKVPLRIESELMVGSLAADLIDHNLLMHPMASRVE